VLPIGQHVEEFVTGLVIMLVGGVTWLFRTVFTNQKEIALLKEEILSRERIRTQDRETLLSMKVELRSDMTVLTNRVESLQSEIYDILKQPKK
jgi:hypothetical protein